MWQERQSDYMEKSFSESYAAAGVDVTAGYESVELIKSHVKKTKIPGVIGSILYIINISEHTSTLYI